MTIPNPAHPAAGTTPTRGPATTYRLEVAGHLGEHWADWLGQVELEHRPDGTTTLTVAVADQAQLHGVLAQLRDIGAHLLGMRELPPTETPEAAAPSLGVVLRTERLVLRPGTADDAAATWPYRRLDEVNEWLTGASESFEDYRALFVDPHRLAATVVVELAQSSPGVVIGDFMLRREDAWAQAEVAEAARGAQAELGWVLDPAYTGVGYATEAVRELLRHCFEDLGVRRVVATCFVDNAGSRRLMERVGMRCETHAVQESLHRSGRWLDTLGYAVLADEWAEDRAAR